MQCRAPMMSRVRSFACVRGRQRVPALEGGMSVRPGPKEGKERGNCSGGGGASEWTRARSLLQVGGGGERRTHAGEQRH